MQNGIGGAAVRVAKWIPFVNASDVSIKANHVMVYAEPSDDIADYYLEAIETLARNEDEEKTDIEKEFIDEETTMALYEKFSNTSITVH